MPGLRGVYSPLRRVPGVGGVATNWCTPKRKGIAIYTHVHEIILREKGAGKVAVGGLEYGSWKNFKPSQRNGCLQGGRISMSQLRQVVMLRQQWQYSKGTERQMPVPYRDMDRVRGCSRLNLYG